MTTLDICDNPIFVVGAPRSGTSMMQWSLRQHPDLWGGQESDFFVPLIEGARAAYEFGTVRGDLHWLSGQHVSREEFVGRVGDGMNALYVSRSGGKRWVEQSPIYTLHLDTMVQMFPGARFIYMLRDGRSVVHSLRNFVHPMSHDDATATWCAYTEAALAFADSASGSAMLTVRYEDVVSDTEAALRSIYDFLDIPYAEASADFISSRRPINSSFIDESSSQEKLGSRWSSWTAAERDSFAGSAGSLIIALGYEADASWVRGRP